MNEWWRASAYVMITVFLGFLLREFGFKGHRIFAILGVIGAVGAVALGIGELIGSFSPLMDQSLSEYTGAAVRIIGVGYVVGICSDICRELGEYSLASTVTVIGRIEIIMISLPFALDIVKQGVEMI